MRHEVILAEIQAGQSLSDPVTLNQGRLAAIRLPSDWEGNANLSFRGADDQGGFFDVYEKTGQEYVLIGALSRYIVIPGGDLDALRAFQIRSGTKDIPITQTAKRTLILHVVVEGGNR